MKIEEIEEKMRMLSQPKLAGADACIVRHIKTGLFCSRFLVVLASLAIAIKVIFVIYFLSELTYGKGELLLSQLVPTMLFVAAFLLARLLVAGIHMKYCERDFEVEVIER